MKSLQPLHATIIMIIINMMNHNYNSSINNNNNIIVVVVIVIIIIIIIISIETHTVIQTHTCTHTDTQTHYSHINRQSHKCTQTACLSFAIQPQSSLLFIAAVTANPNAFQCCSILPPRLGQFCLQRALHAGARGGSSRYSQRE